MGLLQTLQFILCQVVMENKKKSNFNVLKYFSKFFLRVSLRVMFLIYKIFQQLKQKSLPSCLYN